MRKLTDPNAFNKDKGKEELFKESPWKMCPENSYIRQFRVKIDGPRSLDDSALNRIEMNCYDNENRAKR